MFASEREPPSAPRPGSETRTALEPEPGSARRGRPRNPEVEARIMQSAIGLLLERGFDKMTIDDVAAAAGVGKASIYRRWPGKAELAEDALAGLFDVQIPDPDTGTLRGDLEHAYRDTLAFAATPGGVEFIRLAVTEACRAPAAAAAYRRYLRHRADLTAAALDRARRRAEPVRADADAQLLVEWLAGVLIVRAITGQPMPAVEHAGALVDITLHGVTIRTRPDNPRNA
ncbi:TetR family transcriptional regulator [Kribbella sp. VKM Ac-2527]|uniref:TetR family transcriptional regulator n=1 Tax=Kribbella caucasensis TaxID=2512215 RepID=A0A4R6KC26_9ACTN|nr:TetR/AcrR family transcriptional regulator [Kribbella sp. VKM Ac-2527]TDO46813.1 TetR family transcriptional regulator [Kribbella sp. VKM Ac-2527]